VALPTHWPISYVTAGTLVYRLNDSILFIASPPNSSIPHGQPFFYLLRHLLSQLTQESPLTLRLWTSLWNHQCIQLLLSIPELQGLPLSVAPQLRNKLLPVQRLLAGSAFKLWSTWLTQIASPDSSRYYTASRLMKIRSLHRFFSSSTPTTTLRYSLERTQAPEVTCRRITHYYQPLLPLPPAPDYDYTPGEVPLEPIPHRVLLGSLHQLHSGTPMPQLLPSPPLTQDTPPQGALSSTCLAIPRNQPSSPPTHFSPPLYSITLPNLSSNLISPHPSLISSSAQHRDSAITVHNSANDSEGASLSAPSSRARTGIG